MNELEPPENEEGNGNGGSNRLLLGAIVGLVGLLVVGLGLLGYIVYNRSGGLVPGAPAATATPVKPTAAPTTVVAAATATSPAAPTTAPTKAATATAYVPGGTGTPVSATAATATAASASAATATARSAAVTTPTSQATPTGGGEMPQTGAGQVSLLAGMGLIVVVLAARLIRTRGRV